VSHSTHQQLAGNAPVACSVVTVSDTRTEETDSSGRLIRELLEANGHPIVESVIVPDEPEIIRSTVQRLLGACDAVISTGGTGFARRDGTVDALSPLLDRTIPGFGELFRSLSFQEIGAASMLSRAMAGTVGGRLMFMLPGSEAAVRLAMTRLILPEISHLAWELKR
jgi:molybdenum cofactor biosynthesis protein B